MMSFVILAVLVAAGIGVAKLIQSNRRLREENDWRRQQMEHANNGSNTTDRTRSPIDDQRSPQMAQDGRGFSGGSSPLMTGLAAGAGAIGGAIIGGEISNALQEHQNAENSSNNTNNAGANNNTDNNYSNESSTNDSQSNNDGGFFDSGFDGFDGFDSNDL